MKVVLIDPPTSFEQIYGDWDLSAVDTYCPPLGLLHIASFVREHGHEPAIVDVAARKWNLRQAVGFTLSVNPGIVGISAKTINIHNAAGISDGLRAGGFAGSIVLGGAHVTAVPAETLNRYEAFDYGVVGEGEMTFLELIEAVEQGRSVSDIRGLVWRNNLGEIVCNEPRPLIEDLDSLPLPAWDLLPGFPEAYPHSALETKRLPAASLITSRGCPYQCTFCDTAIFGCRLRQHSAQYTLNMIRHLKSAYGIRDVMFLDDNFILDRKKLFTVCDTIVAEQMDLSWYCMGHPRTLTEDRLTKIREAGCWFIELGIESGCDRILQLIKKNATKAQIAEGVRKARDAGLKVKGNFIFGFPTETLETLRETTEFAIRIGLSYFQQNFLTIWPGCELAEDAEKYGNVERDWQKLAHQRVTFTPNGLTRTDLVEASKRAFRRFYLRPTVMFEVLVFSLSSWRAMTNAVSALGVFLRTVSRKSSAETIGS
jgi:anaerobic magnesium-protoporphyrin IX monomethyl ester cyclase